MRHIILISGKDSLATALVQRRYKPSLPYEFVFNPTGWDLPEVLAWIERVERHLGQTIIRCGDDLTEICEEQGWLPTAWRRFCTKYAKIKPLNDYLGKAEATIYFGLRADEPERIGYDPPKYQTACYPLRVAGLRLSDVWKLCSDSDLLPPQFRWVWLERRVRDLLGDEQFLLDRLQPWEQSSLLAWRSRSNCDLCFNVRQYERIGLLEHYPARFEAGCQMEERLGGDRGTGKTCSWVQGYTLRQLALRADEIKERRARQVVGHLKGTQQGVLFAGDSLNDVLAVTSCGLLCGK